jgi:hypothetical protein
VDTFYDATVGRHSVGDEGKGSHGADHRTRPTEFCVLVPVFEHEVDPRHISPLISPYIDQARVSITHGKDKGRHRILSLSNHTEVQIGANLEA